MYNDTVQERDQWECVQLLAVPRHPLPGQHVHHHAAHSVVPATGEDEDVRIRLVKPMDRLQL